MKTALIIGSNDFFAKDLVEKLYMERWRIYTLVSNKRFIKPSHVFEQYVFDYRAVDQTLLFLQEHMILYIIGTVKMLKMLF